MATRKIFKNATTSQAAVKEMLAFVFSQELILPSKDVFVVAPWISNIPVLDNRQGGFMSLNPEWSRSEIHLVDILATIATRGARLHIHVNKDPHNLHTESRLHETLSDSGVSGQCNWRSHKYLHTKGLLTDRVLVSGSMNLTKNGVRILDESVDISFDAQAIATARVHFESYGQD